MVNLETYFVWNVLSNCRRVKLYNGMMLFIIGIITKVDVIQKILPFKNVYHFLFTVFANIFCN